MIDYIAAGVIGIGIGIGLDQTRIWIKGIRHQYKEIQKYQMRKIESALAGETHGGSTAAQHKLWNQLLGNPINTISKTAGTTNPTYTGIGYSNTGSASGSLEAGTFTNSY